MPISDECRLKDRLEVLFRQVHPTHVDESGRIGTLAFVASKEHRFQVSVDRESRIAVRSATEHHITLGNPSAGAWGVAVEECNAAGVQAYDDPDEVKVAHAVIDQGPLGRSGRNKVATKLAADARKRGCLFVAQKAGELAMTEGSTGTGSEATCDTAIDTAMALPKLVDMVHGANGVQAGTDSTLTSASSVRPPRRPLGSG